MDLSGWFDKNFYQTGCFFSLDKKEKIVLAKGGSWKRYPSTGSIQFEIRDFYNH